jgi:co-chaperonin GroES (HSP10)
MLNAMRKKRDVSEFTPVNDQVIVKIIKERSSTDSGILLPNADGYDEVGRDPEYYKIEIIKCSDRALKENPDLKDHKYGFVSIFTGHYLMTKADSYKSVSAFLIVAVTNDNEFTADSIKPTCNRILVKELPKSDQLENGLFISNDVSDPRVKDTNEGVVIKIGDSCLEKIEAGKTAIYDPYVGNLLPRLTKVEEVDVIGYERKQDIKGPIEHEPVTRKEKVTYKVIHEHDITVVY